MNRLLFTFLILCAILSISSCKKYFWKWKTIKCEVRDYYSERPIEGATVMVVDNNKPVGQEVLAFKDTDRNGEVEFKVYAEEGRSSLGVVAGKEPYFNPPKSGDKLNYETHAERKNILYLLPPGYVQFHIKNVNPFDDNDFIDISGLVYYGKNIDVLSPIKKMMAKDIVDFPVNVRKNNVDTFYTTRVIVGVLDTIIYEINY